MPKTYLVLFPGAWGNSRADLVYWWFQVVIAFFSNHFGQNLVVLAMVYDHLSKKRSLNDYANNCLTQLAKSVPDDAQVIAVGYSMGSQVMRLTASKWNGTFTHQVIINGANRFGTRTLNFLRAAALNPMVMIRGLWTKEVVLGKEDIYKFFFAPLPQTNSIKDLCHEACLHSHAESFWACVLMNVWPLRQKTPAMRGLIHHLISADDVLYGVETDGRGLHGEDWNIIKIHGGHGSILDRSEIFGALGKIEWD